MQDAQSRGTTMLVLSYFIMVWSHQVRVHHTWLSVLMPPLDEMLFITRPQRIAILCVSILANFAIGAVFFYATTNTVSQVAIAGLLSALAMIPFEEVFPLLFEAVNTYRSHTLLVREQIQARHLDDKTKRGTKVNKRAGQIVPAVVPEPPAPSRRQSHVSQRSGAKRIGKLDALTSKENLSNLEMLADSSAQVVDVIPSPYRGSGSPTFVIPLRSDGAYVPLSPAATTMGSPIFTPALPPAQRRIVQGTTGSVALSPQPGRGGRFRSFASSVEEVAGPDSAHVSPHATAWLGLVVQRVGPPRSGPSSHLARAAQLPEVVAPAPPPAFADIIQDLQAAGFETDSDDEDGLQMFVPNILLQSSSKNASPKQRSPESKAAFPNVESPSGVGPAATPPSSGSKRNVRLPVLSIQLSDSDAVQMGPPTVASVETIPLDEVLDDDGSPVPRRFSPKTYQAPIRIESDAVEAEESKAAPVPVAQHHAIVTQDVRKQSAIVPVVRTSLVVPGAGGGWNLGLWSLLSMLSVVQGFVGLFSGSYGIYLAVSNLDRSYTEVVLGVCGLCMLVCGLQSFFAVRRLQYTWSAVLLLITVSSEAVGAGCLVGLDMPQAVYVVTVVGSVHAFGLALAVISGFVILISKRRSFLRKRDDMMRVYRLEEERARNRRASVQGRYTMATRKITMSLK